MSSEEFGSWIALAIHDTSSVIGAAMSFGDGSVETATTLKLARTLWLIPLTIILGIFYKDSSSKNTLPLFVFAFILAVLLGTQLNFSNQMILALENISSAFLVGALFCIGAQIDKKSIKALLVNTKNANTFTGKQGKESLDILAKNLAKNLTLKESKAREGVSEVIRTKDLIFASTGVIGEQFPVEQIKNVLPDLVQKLKAEQNKLYWLKIASSIMTTDTKPKVAYEEFIVGDIYEHRPGRTITQSDNIWFTLLTMNQHPLHIDDEYGKGTEFGKTLVVSPFTVALMVGMSVSDVSQKTVANLGWTDIKMTHPLYVGDTLYAESEVIEKRESKSRPDEGIVTVKTIGKNQDGVEVASFIRSALIPKDGKAVEDKIDY